MATIERRVVDNVVAPGLDILFCGVNPGMASARVRHHLAHPGDRFWRTLHRSGLTPELLGPEQEHRLLAYGLGVTNLVDRATPAAAELQAQELRRGAVVLGKKARRLQPRTVAVLGLGAFRIAFGQPRATVGER